MTTLTSPRLHARVLSSFDDSALTPAPLERIAQSQSHELSQPYAGNGSTIGGKFFGRGQLMLVVIEEAGRPVCIAPLFADDGMVFNICPEDHLDLIGEVSSEIVEAIIRCAMEQVPNFQGLRMYFVPKDSPTADCVQQVADRLGLFFIEESSIPSPQLEIAARPDVAAACTRKKSLLRHENYFRREGRVVISHACTGDDILLQLDKFFEQHVARRTETPNPSLFVDATPRLLPQYCRQHRPDWLASLHAD